MKLSPLDIKKAEFRRGMRGYDPEEVSAFLQMVSDQWQEMSDEMREAERRISELETKLSHYSKVEEALQEALSTARDSSRQAVETAEKKAKLILEEVHGRAQRIVRDAEEKKIMMASDIVKLEDRRAEVLARLRAFLKVETEMLDRFEDEVGSRSDAESSATESSAAVEATPPLATGPVEERSSQPEVVELPASTSLAPGAFVFTTEVVDSEPANAEPMIAEPAEINPETPSFHGYDESPATSSPIEEYASELEPDPAWMPGSATDDLTPDSPVQYAYGSEPPAADESAEELDKIRRILDDLD